ncbi:MAG: hypothetical protein LBC65_05710 [Oscillospiraceae bacterium]|jgi:flagellar motility protein MotE (MotC chaperone)|nr:hypothetical protein [Oscillospiraceae bacterium]
MIDEIAVGGNSAASKPRNARASSSEVVKPKRKSLRLKVTIIVLVVLVIAAAGFFVFMVAQMDLFGLRTQAFAYVRSLDPSYSSTKILETRLNEREAELKAREAEVESQETALVGREEAVAARETEVTARESAAKSQKGMRIYRRPTDSMTERETADMTALAETYAQMSSPTVAAGILSKLASTEDMAAILYFMSPEDSARILSVMEPSIAADITDKLLRY